VGVGSSVPCVVPAIMPPEIGAIVSLDELSSGNVDAKCITVRKTGRGGRNGKM
jgi:hypothetical protein